MRILIKKATSEEQKICDKLSELYESDKEKTKRVNNFLKVLVKYSPIKRKDIRPLLKKPFIPIKSLSGILETPNCSKLLKIISGQYLSYTAFYSVDMKLPDGTILRPMASGIHTKTVMGVFRPNGDKWVIRIKRGDSAFADCAGVQEFDWEKGRTRKERYCGTNLRDLILIAKSLRDKIAVNLLKELSDTMSDSKVLEDLKKDFGPGVKGVMADNIAYDYERKEFVVIDMD